MEELTLEEMKAKMEALDLEMERLDTLKYKYIRANKEIIIKKYLIEACEEVFNEYSPNGYSLGTKFYVQTDKYKIEIEIL
jgi:hypothetical protein